MGAIRHRGGVVFRHMPIGHPVRLSDQQLAEAFRLFTEEWKTLKEIAKMWNIGETPLGNRMHKKYPDFEFKRRAARVNENFFKQLTKESAYVMGLIASDGNVCDDLMLQKKGSNFWSIELQSRDVEILEKVKKYIGYEGKLSHMPQRANRPNSQPTTILRVVSNQMVEDLKSLGIVPRKSLILKTPVIFHNNDVMFWHYLRGYFDGDGCAWKGSTKDRPGYTKYSASIVGTRETCEYASKTLCKYGIGSGRNLYTKNPKVNTWCYAVMGNRNVKRFYHLIYKDAGDLYLTRKKEKLSGLDDLK
jgi:hypothetical protein